jgi:alpha-D-xyloside xylohydrolase
MKHFESRRLNEAPDVSAVFRQSDTQYFLANEVTQFDPEKQSGLLHWKRSARKARLAFNQFDFFFEDSQSWEFPPDYPESPQMPFDLSFVTPRTARIRLQTRRKTAKESPSLMLAGDVAKDTTWRAASTDNGYIWESEFGQVELKLSPFHLIFKDANGKVLTSTQHYGDTWSLQNAYPTPLSYARSIADMSHRVAATFTLSPGEKIFGTGESFTGLNKRGQRVDLWTRDALGSQSEDMYKPIPFFLSSRGYGMFIHSSAAMSLDFGKEYDASSTLYIADDSLDLFFFFGEPKEVLSEYTALTGRSPLPPLWSFGLWMSRITYNSEAQAREVAQKLREHEIPCDVIHLDTGWFEEDWRCDYEFSKSRFDDPKKMIEDLRKEGFRICLWQLPYFTPSNPYFQELIDKGLMITDSEGNLPTEDAILDFSNPEAVEWYQEKIAGLLDMGVAAIKVDFGEGAPIYGRYHSGKSGRTEHNLYPLRYNKAVADVTKGITGDSIIWARSAWAGSQRYPLHWGGDAENTDSAMLASLRAGLSLGLCGFTFWSHDIGGFVKKSPESLYRRWMPFGMLTSHSRTHGAPPKEPWEYSESFMNDFREAAKLKYRLMPYIYTQAYLSSQSGYPMMRTMFFEYPDDPTCWMIEDQYFFGTDLLVAPLFEEVEERIVYLPAGQWIDYQTGTIYEGGRWERIAAGAIPIVVLVRSGSIIPQVEPALSLDRIDWDTVQFTKYSADGSECMGQFYHPVKRRLIENV